MNFVFQLTENCSTNPCDKGVCEMVNTTHPFSGVSFYYILEVILFILVSPCYQTAPVIYIITLKDTFHSIHSFVKDMPNVARIEKKLRRTNFTFFVPFLYVLSSTMELWDWFPAAVITAVLAELWFFFYPTAAPSSLFGTSVTSCSIRQSRSAASGTMNGMPPHEMSALV